jgi:hypothetical protein
LRRRGESGFHQGRQSGKQQSRILQETRSLCPYAEPAAFSITSAQRLWHLTHYAIGVPSNHGFH